jgi:hypothetical protein
MKVRQLFYVLVVFCLFGMTLSFSRQPVFAQQCDYYASPNGNGNGLSESSPFQIGDFLSMPESEMQGKTLCLLDGTYYESLNISKSGTASQPINIRALHDGEAKIDGENARQPAVVSGSYIVVEGIIFQNSSGNVVTVTGGHNIFRRLSAYNANPDGNYHIWIEYGATAQGNLYEDIVAAGTGRVCVEPFRGSADAVYRRVYARMGSGPSSMYHTCYQPYSAVNSLCENCILAFEEGTSPAPGPAMSNVASTGEPLTIPEGNRLVSSIIRDFTEIVDGQSNDLTPQHFSVENTVNIRSRDNGLLLRTGATNVSLSNIVVIDAPTAVASDNFRGNSNPSQVEIKDSVFVGNNIGLRASDGTTQFANYSIFYNNGNDFSGDVTEGQGNIFTDPGYDVSMYGDGAYLIPPPNFESKGENGQRIGADIRFRSVNSESTDEPLWPWPMEERICNELGVSVTWEQSGQISANTGEYCGGGLWKTLDGVYEGNDPTFTDVPSDHWAYDYIEMLYQEGYIAGCSIDPLMYCPEATMIRAESAVFVERGIHGAETLPDQPTEQVFADVPLTEWFAKWATALWDDGYTSGCGIDPLIYCPLQGHTRAEGSVFFLRMMHGVDYVPPEPSGLFADVPTTAWYADWSEAAYNAGIIPACHTEPELLFCPEDPLDRAMAAYMMVQAKGIQIP